MGVKACAGCGAEFEAIGNTRRCPPCRGQSPPAAERPSVLAAVDAQLAAIGKHADPLGAVAHVLAGRLDLGLIESGAALTALSKELRTIMVELTRTAASVADPVDELLERRKARRKVRLGA
ncbi:MAG TPA: hypothetical protein VFF24_03085 [Acidimicrobiia bacterium]|nr:hypothetical protein [Acidimicrobiia bacterium]